MGNKFLFSGVFLLCSTIIFYLRTEKNRGMSKSETPLEIMEKAARVVADHRGLARTFCSFRHSAGVASDLGFSTSIFRLFRK